MCGGRRAGWRGARSAERVAASRRGGRRAPPAPWTRAAGPPMTGMPSDDRDALSLTEHSTARVSQVADARPRANPETRRRRQLPPRVPGCAERGSGTPLGQGGAGEGVSPNQKFGVSDRSPHPARPPLPPPAPPHSLTPTQNPLAIEFCFILPILHDALDLSYCPGCGPALDRGI